MQNNTKNHSNGILHHLCHLVWKPTSEIARKITKSPTLTVTKSSLLKINTLWVFLVFQREKIIVQLCRHLQKLQESTSITYMNLSMNFTLIFAYTYSLIAFKAEPAVCNTCKVHVITISINWLTLRIIIFTIMCNSIVSAWYVTVYCWLYSIPIEVAHTF